MELFSELYGVYYRAVGEILKKAAAVPLSLKEIQDIISSSTFPESAFYILPKLENEDWPLLKKTPEGYKAKFSILNNQPLTLLQLSWLNSILSDPRIRLFFEDEELDILQSELKDANTLFKPKDFHAFDIFKDGDNYENHKYRENFKEILNALHTKAPVKVTYMGGKGSEVQGIFYPYKMEYSNKDDKFRVLCYKPGKKRNHFYILNLNRIISASKTSSNSTLDVLMKYTKKSSSHYRTATFEITKERNALERCMIQFAHYEKRTEHDDETDIYTCYMKYNVLDETEVVIRLLSFGPTIKVLGCPELLAEIKTRVKKQYLLLNNGI